MAYKNKCSDLPKDRERYGTFPIFGETKNEYGAPAPAGKANARFLEKQKQNKCNVAILHSSKHIGGRKAAETLQYRILSDLQLLPSARTKASVRFSTERKTNGTLIATLQKPEGSLWHTEWLHIAIFGEGTIIFMLGMERGQHGTIRGHGQDCICRLLFSFWAFCCMME